MCAPPVLLAGVLGGLQAVQGIQQQNRAHQAQVDAVNRSNSMARQKYLNDIMISAYDDQRKSEVFQAQLKSDAASRQAYYKQREINQVEANRATEALDQELQEKLTEQMFNSQTNLAKSIQAQGTVLASGQASGQSMLLSLTQAEREFGFEQAQIDATVFDATRSYGIDKYGIDLDQYSADIKARNKITTSAHMSPAASQKTIRPIKQQAPRKPSILGPILGGISTGIKAGTGLGGQDYWKKGLSDGVWN